MNFRVEMPASSASAGLSMIWPAWEPDPFISHVLLSWRKASRSQSSRSWLLPWLRPAGDTKVAGKGQVDGVFITTTAVGEILPGAELSGAYAKPGDKILVTGDVGRHGAAILLARDAFGIEADVTSDCAPLWETVRSMLAATREIHVIRDATRGGVGTVLYEIASESHVGIRLERSSVPVDPAVSGVCGMLGLEPLYLACEGRMVVFAPAEQAEKLLDVLRKGKYSENAAIIGEVTDTMPGRVVVRTPIGAETLLPPPGGELLPRIC